MSSQRVFSPKSGVARSKRGVSGRTLDRNRAGPACCIFGTIITCHKFFNAEPSTTADVVGSSDRLCATGMKETSQKGTVRVSVSALLTRLRCSSSELKN